MQQLEKFSFLDSTAGFARDAFVIKIPREISDSTALFQAIYDHAMLPGWFGFNWDATSDCLRDFSWIENHSIVVHHVDLPCKDVSEQRIYIFVLLEAIDQWRIRKEHSLEVVFPTSARSDVQRILAQGAPWL
jgi:Barstar (barnase inhibitor)